MIEKIEAYLLEEKKKGTALRLCLEKMSANPDIARAFAEWIDRRDFGAINCPEIEGYDAKRIASETNLSPMGVFNYLVFLRNDPVEAVAALKMGLPRR